MKKLLKFLLWLIVGLTALIVLAVVLVMLFVDPNDYKDEIAQLVKDKTGRDLAFTGDISLTFFPWLGVEVGGMTLSNAPGFGDEPMVAVGSAGASVRIMPLVSGDVEIGTVRLKDVRVLLAVNQEGVANWDDLAAEEETPVEETPAASVEDTGRQGGGFDLSLGGVEVENLSLVFDDQQAGQRYEVSELGLVVGEVVPAMPFEFTMTALVTTGDPEVTAQTTLSGLAGLDVEAGLYQVSGLKLGIEAAGGGVPGGQATADLAADGVWVDLAENKAEMEGFVLNAYGASASGSLTATNLDTDFTVAGALELAPCDLREVLVALGQDPPETTDPEAMAQAAASVQFAYRSDVLTADKVEATLDQTSVKASVNITGLSDIPTYSFVAVVDDIDLDRYLPPDNEDQSKDETTESEPQPEGEGGEETAEESSPVEFLRTLTLDGQATVGRLRLAGGEFTDITVTIKAADGVLDLEPIGLSCYGGKVQAAYSMDAGPAQPLSNLDLTLTRVNIGRTLRDMTGRAYISGVMNLTTTRTVTCQSLDGDTMLKTLNGGFDFTALNGTLPSGGVASNILSLASGVLFTSGSATQGQDITYDSITATSRINKGVIRNDYLILKSPSLWAEGAGIINLNALTIDYQASAKLVSDPDPDEKYDDVTAPEVAVYATGDLSDPTVNTGILEGLGNLGIGVVEDVGEGAWDVVVGVGEAAGDFVEGLFSSDDEPAAETSDEAETQDTAAEPKQEESGNILEEFGKSIGIEF